MSPTSVQRRKFLFEASRRLQTLIDFEDAIERKPGAASDYIELAHSKLGLTRALQLAKFAFQLGFINANQYKYYEKQATRRSARLVRKDIGNPRETPDDPSSGIGAPLPDEPEASIARCTIKFPGCKKYIMPSDMADNLPSEKKARLSGYGWACSNCANGIPGAI